MVAGSLTYGGVSFLFGDGTPFPLTGFVRGVSQFRVADQDRPRRDGRLFGRDYKSGPTHTLSLLFEGVGVSRAEREADVRALLEEFARVWSADSLRATPGAVAKLTVGDRSCYGRPREFTPDDSGLWDGVANPEVQFVAADDLWYGASQSTTIRFGASTGGGLRFPAQAPFRFGGQPSVRNSAIEVAGARPVAPVFEIRGPVASPSIDIPGVGTLSFNVSLAFDERLVVDTGAGWVKRGYIGGDLAAAPGLLSPAGSRLSDIRLSPGAHTVVLRGTDSTNTAELTVTVEPVYSGI